MRHRAPSEKVKGPRDGFSPSPAQPLAGASPEPGVHSQCSLLSAVPASHSLLPRLHYRRQVQGAAMAARFPGFCVLGRKPPPRWWLVSLGSRWWCAPGVLPWSPSPPRRLARPTHPETPSRMREAPLAKPIVVVGARSLTVVVPSACSRRSRLHRWLRTAGRLWSAVVGFGSGVVGSAGDILRLVGLLRLC